MDGETYKILLQKILKKWYLFLLFMVLAVGAAYLYLESKQPIYQAKAIMLIRDDAQSGEAGAEALFEDLGILATNKKLENELLVLGSTPLMESVVAKNNLHYQYFVKERFRTTELYLNAPVSVASWQPAHNEVAFYADLKMSDSLDYILTIEDSIYNGKFGDALDLPLGELILTKKEGADRSKDYLLRIIPPEIRSKELLESIGIEVVNENSSILELKAKDPSPDKAQLILHNLLKEYNDNSQSEKINTFEKTIDLINNRINLVASELNRAELAVEQYKSQRGMTDANSEGGLLQNMLATQSTEISDLRAQIEILDIVEEYLTQEESFEFVPFNVQISNIALSNQMSSFNQLLQDRSTQEAKLGPSHPNLIQIEKQIQNLRQSILENIRAIRRDLSVQRDRKNELASDFESRLKSLPRMERELVQIERNKEGKESLYWYLLQKKTGAEIAKAATIPLGKIIEPATASGSPISPNRMQIWLIAGFLGLAIPAGILYLSELLKTSITSEEDITRISNVPVICSIGSDRTSDNIAVSENSRTSVAEMFRLLRTNLHFVSENGAMRKLLITSSMSGEGKSYISLNLAIVQALAGKKVLLLQLDLRKPSQKGFKKLKVIGLSSYLADADKTMDDIIQKSGINENLDLILAGPIPPNPNELLLSSRLQELLTQLEKIYDFIIIDSPPVGLVSDAFHLKDQIDATMFVVRSSTTQKSQIKIINDISENKKLPQPFIVLNGLSKTYQNSYGAYGKNYYVKT